jgi:hypothetical protein
MRSYEKRHFVVVLPGGVKVFKDLEIRDERPSYIQNDIRAMAQGVVCAAKLTTPRKNPQTIKVKVFEQTIQNGQMVEKFSNEFDIQPSLERMTASEYAEEYTAVVKDLPIPFKDFVADQVADRDPSCFEERIDVAIGITRAIADAIAKYDAMKGVKS